MKVLSLISALFLTFVISLAPTFGQEKPVPSADLRRMLWDGRIGRVDSAGQPYRFTQSGDREKFVVESGGNNTYRAVYSGPAGRPPVRETIRVGETIYERRDAGPWTSQNLAEYREEKAKIVEEMKAALSKKDNKRYKELQSFYNPATILVVERMYLSLYTLFLSFPKDTVVKRLESKGQGETYQSTGSFKFDSPADKDLRESRFINELEFDAKSGLLVAARHKIDWIYVNKTVTYVTTYKWELDPGISIKAPI